nr:MAG TPA: hypothetical protein [Siphoviridae sp. cta6m1]
MSLNRQRVLNSLSNSALHRVHRQPLGLQGFGLEFY